jgi:hypothetical protein
MAAFLKQLGTLGIPGFRSGSLWKQLIAGMGYLAIAAWLIQGISGKPALLAFGLVSVLTVVLVTNAWNLRFRVPLLPSTNRVAMSTGWAVLGLLTFSTAVWSVGGQTTVPSRSTAAATTARPAAQARPSVGTPAPSLSVVATATPTSTPVLTPAPTLGPKVAERIIGFGATTADWNANHVATTDSGLAAGCCYNPDSTLPKVNGHVAYRYFTVNPTNDRVMNYLMDLHPGTTIAEAKAEMLREFPSDASVLWFAVKDTCAQMEVQSATLGNVFGTPSIGDPKGEVFVEVYTVQAGGDAIYDPRNLNEGLLILLSKETAADAGAC